MVDDENTVSTMALPGLARALVNAGTLPQKTAEELYAKAQSKKSSFIAELTGSGSVSPADLAHIMSQAFAAPLVDLQAVDVQRLPKDLLDTKICAQFRIIVLSKRGNRLTVATADPSDHQAAEKIKFATQLGVDWVIAEYDKLSKLVETLTATAGEADEVLFLAIAGEGEISRGQPGGTCDPGLLAGLIKAGSSGAQVSVVDEGLINEGAEFGVFEAGDPVGIDSGAGFFDGLPGAGGLNGGLSHAAGW